LSAALEDLGGCQVMPTPVLHPRKEEENIPAC